MLSRVRFNNRRMQQQLKCLGHGSLRGTIHKLITNEIRTPCRKGGAKVS